MKFENHVTRNDVMMMSLSKTMGKCGPPRKQTNIYCSKGFDESFQKRNFYQILTTVSKVMGVYVNFYHDHLPNMVISRDSGRKFQNFYFLPNSALNFRKSHQIWGN